MKLSAYLLYCLIWDLGIIGCGAYVVFWRGHSAWWILVAFVISWSGGFSAETFRDLAGRPKKETT